MFSPAILTGLFKINNVESNEKDVYPIGEEYADPDMLFL